MPPLGFDALLAHNAHRLADCFRGASCGRLSGTERGPVDRPARRGGQGDCANGTAGDAAARRRPARRRASTRRSSRSAISSSRSRDEGEPATEKTDAWIFFDDANLYIAARCWDSHPEREVANELRRDNGNILGNENFTFVIDTFHDRRNGYLFQTNPLGALRDMTVTDDQQNSAWNGIWYVKTGRFEQGWTMEVAIPFKSLRYRGSGAQDMGHQPAAAGEVEERDLVPVAGARGARHRRRQPDGVGGDAGRARDAGAVEEHRAEAVRRVVGDDRSRRAAVPFDNDPKGNAGFDFKYGLTRSLIVDATYRTDFAQVEEDQQQINLTRFSLFFPEKRDFFIEGQGIFDFGGVQAGNTPGRRAAAVLQPPDRAERTGRRCRWSAARG